MTGNKKTGAWEKGRKWPAGDAHLLILLIPALLLVQACSGENDGGKTEVLKENIHGFHLGESRDGLFERVRHQVSWKKLEDPATGSRGEMYEFSRVLSQPRDVDHARLTFFDGRLMEIIVYYRQNNVSKLNFLRDTLEERYGVESTSPDGTIEMAYKTYWLKGPGMSITIRRITKKPEDELYVQYLHDGLHERLRKIRKLPGR
ncbi:MAG: hypothetical protein JW814_01430 [Candidatus Krumholzibacteriota bacterium]|nr:hypothetical protein [Candidatus Krumholzibacteriota bacterium]